MIGGWTKRCHSNALILLVLGFCLFSVPARADIKVLHLRHISSNRALPMVKDLIGSSGKVTEWENKLIVNASPEEIASVEEVLSQIDVPPVMLKISVRRENRSVLAGHDNLGLPPVDRPPGNKSSNLNLGNSLEETEYFLRVQEGLQGFLLVGQSVPFIREMAVLAHRHAGYRQNLDFQLINSGFWVRPVLVGEMAHLDIRPHLEGFQKNSAGLTGMPSPIDLQNLETSVRVPLGRWVDIAGVLREADEISRAIVTWKTGNSRKETTLWLKIDRQQDDFHD
ncbi:MAG: secretin N-terminal domain-containing protein [Syntrophotaleaceae bacterium]